MLRDIRTEFTLKYVVIHVIQMCNLNYPEVTLFETFYGFPTVLKKQNLN